MKTPQESIQAQANEVIQFTTWLSVALFMLWVGKKVGGWEKKIANDILDVATPKEIPVRLPQTRPVTVICPICGKVVEIPKYDLKNPRSVTRSEALRQHIEKEHTSKLGLQAQALLIEGGEEVPSRYRDLVGLVNEPLPEYSLSVLPAVETATGERKIDAVMAQLKAGVEGIVDSYQFRLFLNTMAKFHDYSIGNQILIMLQKPDATRVAGYNTWKDMERWVKPGEKGIAILAPVMPPRATCAECDARIPRGARYCPKCGAAVDIEGEVSPRFFKVVHVFDLGQTEGKPLPEFEVPVLTGEKNEALFNRLLALMERSGVTVSFESRPYQDPGIKGQYLPPSQIWVRPEEHGAQQLKTLLHEVAHYYSEGVLRMPRQDAETIAESAAYVVGAHYGFDTGVRSFPYVALWSRDKKTLDQNLNAIRRVATTMLEGLEK
ncbi:MAG: ArdC family protein [Dehalococcoidales bacterium]|nr:ArdC family protein [Dehalococcoidales bacterium]